MKKALQVLLWLALIASAITLLSWNGQKETLAKEARTAKARQENMQNRYTQDQKDWKNQETALKAENDTLTQEKADLCTLNQVCITMWRFLILRQCIRHQLELRISLASTLRGLMILLTVVLP